MIDNVRFIATSGLLIVCIILMTFQKCENDSLEEKVQLMSAMEDTLARQRNRDGTQTAKIALLQAENTKQLLKIKTQDESIKQLQAEVEANKRKIQDGGSVTIFTTITTHSSVANTTVQPNDSDSCGTYTASHNDNWVSWETKATSINTTLNLKVKNAYSVVIGSEKTGLFKRRPIVEVTNKNPHTEIQTLRAFEVKDTRNNRLHLSAHAGYGITLYGLSPYLGGGLSFTIW